MIAVDTSSLAAYFAGETGKDVEAVETGLEQEQVVLPPVVLCELLSNPKLPASVAALIRALPVLPLSDGCWERAGRLRAKVLARSLRARLADTLIAQCCIDSDALLVTRDADFRHFERIGGLRLLRGAVLSSTGR